MKIMSSFTYPHVIPKTFFLKHKWRYYFIFFFHTGKVQCCVTNDFHCRDKIFKMPFKGLKASFTNSLRQRKPSFGVKILLSGFTKTRSDELALKRCGQLFLHLTLLNMHFYKFPFQMQNFWEENIQMNHATRFTNVCARQSTGICAII